MKGLENGLIFFFFSEISGCGWEVVTEIEREMVIFCVFGGGLYCI